MSMHEQDWLTALSTAWTTFTDFVNNHRKLSLGVACFLVGVAVTLYLI